MTRRGKLIAKIRARPPEADFADVALLLQEFGWEMRSQKGSHCVFVKPGETPITVVRDRGRRVKRGYLDRICERLGLDQEP